MEYWEYEWDILNRMTRVSRNNEPICRYTYDIDGLRSIKYDFGSGETTHYLYEGNDLIFEKNVTTGKARSYIYGMGKQIGRVEGHIGLDDEFVEDVRYYYHTDHLGSVRAVTDEDGCMVWEGEYDAFGNLLTEELLDEGYEPEYVFAGKKVDGDVGLYYFNARWYDSTTGRFISEDPVRDGMNWFGYCGNNPLVFVD